MQAIILKSFSDDASTVEVRDVEAPTPGPGQVLVRMRMSPINPSDFNYIDGTYHQALERLIWNQGASTLAPQPGGDPFPSPPYALGVEGVGVVEAAGDGFLGKRLVGRRVAVAGGPPNGTWRELAVIDARRAFPVPRSLKDEEACSFFVNPLTALALVRHVLKVRRGAWLLQTAAGSALAGMVRNLAKQNDFQVINVVRSEAGAARLRESGVKHVIATERTALIDAVHGIAPHGVSYVLDCVGGALGSDVLRCLGPRGHMVCYGTLSREPITLPPRDIMMPFARVEGFYLPSFLQGRSLPQRFRLVRQTAKLIAAGTLGTPVQQTHALADIRAALDTARRPGRTGKVLLRLGTS